MNKTGKEVRLRDYKAEKEQWAARRKEIIKKWVAGVPVRQIASEYDVSTVRIYAIIKTERKKGA